MNNGKNIMEIKKICDYKSLSKILMSHLNLIKLKNLWWLTFKLLDTV